LPQQWPASLQACSPARAQLGVARTPAAVGFHLDAVLATRFVSTPLFRGSVAPGQTSCHGVTCCTQDQACMSAGTASGRVAS
jgi:hypothetical protein